MYRLATGLLLVAVLGIGGYYRSLYLENPGYQGDTMGTSFSIRISGRVRKIELRRLRRLIDAALVDVNKQMSTWDAESEISRFNHSGSTDPFPVSADFATVVRRAITLSDTSGGAFDPTLQPLLNLWGFGSEGGVRAVPSDEAIQAAKAMTGWTKITVTQDDALRKTEPGVSLALGAIAKGYGVDRIGRILREEGFEDWFVEIGGEVVVQGLNPGGEPWRIGIQYPGMLPQEDRVQGVLHLTAGAVATSGDYRNYLVKDGVIYSHILDPRSGRAVLTDTASVSVYAPDCTEADGLATTLFVMGPQEGLEWIETMPGIEALFLVRSEGAIIEKFSSGFVGATGYTSFSGEDLSRPEPDQNKD